MKLPVDTFKTVISSTPLVSIDFVVSNSAGEILLGERLNRPAQGYWFVPGGRVVKDESLAQAFLRLTEEELGVQVAIDQGRFIGLYEHFYADNFFGENGSTHYIVLCFQFEMDIPLEHLPPQQHGRYQWWDKDRLLEDPAVHQNTKRYFNKEISA